MDVLTLNSTMSASMHASVIPLTQNPPLHRQYNDVIKPRQRRSSSQSNEKEPPSRSREDREPRALDHYVGS